MSEILKKNNSVEFEVSGNYALFTDPVTRIGGEKFTYQVPTYQALKGILESVFWKPTIVWTIDAVRVMNIIQTEGKGIRPLNYDGGNDLAFYTYLKDVKYQVRAHFDFNLKRTDLAADRNEKKYISMANRMIEKGGRRDVFLGTRECQAYVTPCEFGSGVGAYDNVNELAFGPMFHGFDYPDEIEKNELGVRYWNYIMKQGIIDFPTPDDETLRRRTIKKTAMKTFSLGINVKNIEEEENS